MSAFLIVLARYDQIKNPDFQNLFLHTMPDGTIEY